MLGQDDMKLRFGKHMRVHTLVEVLPERFGPHSLLREGLEVPLLLQPQSHDVHLATSEHT